jgi:hypothetical protein
MCQQQGKTSRNGKRAVQLAGSAVEGSLDLDLVFLFLSSFPVMVAWSLSRKLRPVRHRRNLLTSGRHGIRRGGADASPLRARPSVRMEAIKHLVGRSVLHFQSRNSVNLVNPVKNPRILAYGVIIKSLPRNALNLFYKKSQLF